VKKKILPLVIAATVLSPFLMAEAPNTALNLMPYPQQVEQHNSSIQLNSDFTVFIKGFQSDRVSLTAKRFIDRLERQTGMPILDWQTSDASSADLIIDIQRGPKTKIQNIDSDESYRITMKGQQITLSSLSPYGAIRGIETLLQLVYTTRAGYFMPAVTIVDEPRFRWRGVSFDTSRHFIDFDVLLRQIDAMTSAKMNVFHWHFWDDQGIRIKTDS